MPINLEYLGIVARIDARMQQLDPLGLGEIEILNEMADMIADFHTVLRKATRQEYEALCAEFAGFQRFTKIMRTLRYPWRPTMRRFLADYPAKERIKWPQRLICASCKSKLRALMALNC